MLKNLKEYIRLEDCIDGHVYKICARNGSFGVFSRGKKKDDKEWANGNNTFTLSRWKFSSNYLFDEFHWDLGKPFGTVKPVEDLGPSPVFKDDKEKLKYLNELAASERDNQ